jgi:DNA-binding CsgD family transcriptional regulator
LEDVVGIAAGEVRGRGLYLGIPVSPGQQVSPRRINILGYVAAHLVAARRLRELARRGTGELPEPSDASDEWAMLGPASARNASGWDAVAQRIEAAREIDRGAALERADTLWQGLMDGTLVLVHHWESGGQRLALARRATGTSDPKALNARERVVVSYALVGYSTKYIAWLMGISAGTVGSQLASACEKLGVESRRQLLQVFGAAQASGGHAVPGGAAGRRKDAERRQPER